MSTQATDTELKELLEKFSRNSIVLNISEEVPITKGWTRFGGQPDVPPDFEWPTFKGENCESITKERPLSFLAQFDCSELSRFDSEGLLPDHGLLSFFYEVDSQRWGFDPTDKGCARVYWFEDMNTLSPAPFPEEMEDDFKFPVIGIQAQSSPSIPSYEDFLEICPEYQDKDEDEELFDKLMDEVPEEQSKLLGWPDTIQNSMFAECDIVSKGHYTGNAESWRKIPKGIREQAEKTARDRWTLLFQLDTVEGEDFELMFGDCGRIYFFIQRDDLKAKRFDQTWLISQCY